MRESTIARNYAETLIALARKADDLHGWGKTIQGVADAVRENPTLRIFLESPKISAARKNEIFLKAFGDRVPRLFLKFLQALVIKRRQNLIPEIAVEYWNLVDLQEGRIHAQVTVARESSVEEKDAIAKHLSRVLGGEVIPHLSVNPAILGGVVVKVGDTVMDGSVRKRLATLRSRMIVGRT